MFQRRLRRGRKKTRRPARLTATPGATLRPRTPGLSADCSRLMASRTFAVGEMVRTVVPEDPPGTMEDGAKRQTAPEGRPPVQAKVMVEWKSPDGVTVRVTGLEVLPREAVVEVVVGERVKAPEGARMVRVTAAEVSD